MTDESHMMQSHDSLSETLGESLALGLELVFSSGLDFERVLDIVEDLPDNPS